MFLDSQVIESSSSFICSSNNNIARISKMVQSLCKHYSPCLVSLPPPDDALDTGASGACDEDYHPFPSPSALLGLGVAQTLRTLGFGYRAEFVHRTAQMITEAHGSLKLSNDHQESGEKFLLTLRNLETAQARDELLKFLGVGRKVADCVLLMSLDKVSATLITHNQRNSIECLVRYCPC